LRKRLKVIFDKLGQNLPTRVIFGVSSRMGDMVLKHSWNDKYESFFVDSHLLTTKLEG